jgi:two-component system, NtrC family, sensor histidine kinase HydH
MRLTVFLSKSFSIKHLLLGAFTLAVLIPSIVIASLTFLEARNALKTEIEHDLTSRTSAVMDEIDRTLFERLQNIASWSQLEIMQDANIGDIDKRLSTFLAELKLSYLGVYQDLFVLDGQNKVVASSESRQINKMMNVSPVVSQVSLINVLIYVHAVQAHCLPISIQIKSDNLENTQFRLLAYFNLSQLSEILDHANVGQSKVILQDKDNQTIVETHALANPNASTIKVSAIAKGYKTFNGLTWKLTVVKFRQEVLAPIHQMGLVVLVVSVMAVLIAFLLALPIANVIAQPVVKLTQFAKQYVTMGKATLPPQHGPLEIMALTDAFSAMIIDLEEAQKNLTRATKLATVGEMAAAMSHEVRTPLGIIRSSAQVLMREPALTYEGKEVCGFVISETERLNKLVSSLIDSAKPRALELSKGDVVPIIAHAKALLQNDADKKNIRIYFDCVAMQPHPSYWVNMDAEQMMQIMLNLMQNAIQILPMDGHIWVSAKKRDDLTLEISVADDGFGISEDQREHVFEPFFSQRSGGIGLGLAIVKQMVNAHFGQIIVRESQYKGAEFIITLPMQQT